MRFPKKNYYKPYGGKRVKFWMMALCALLALGILTFILLQCHIQSRAKDSIHGEPEIMVIFGCQVKPWGPSILLQDRLDKALEYLADHPDMTVVVTGGKGDDEHVSEARCMRDYLVEHGFPSEQILMEDRSRNTWQNINYTLDMPLRLSEKGELEWSPRFLVVSNGFHLARIQMLWGRACGGTYSLSTLAAPVTHKPSGVQMFFREPLALVKSFVLDR